MGHFWTYNWDVETSLPLAQIDSDENKRGKKNIQQIKQVIRATIILHIFLIEEKIEEYMSDADEGRPEYADELNQSAYCNSKLCHTQLMNYFHEKNLL